MLNEHEPVAKTSWQRLREQSYSFWSRARSDGRPTRFGHPDELAEHVVFKIVDFFKAQGEQELAVEIATLKKGIARGRYEEVIDGGEVLYQKRVLPQNPDANKSLVSSILTSLEN
jgi:hypothetical protein